MKKTITTSIGLLFLTTTVFALDPLGPPVATSKKDVTAIAGFEYLYGVMDLHSESFTFITHPIPPTPSVSLLFSSAKIKNIKTNKFYVNLISEIGGDDLDIFLRLGIANANPDKSANRDNLAGNIGESDYDIALGGGIRTTFYQSEDGREKWGILAQLSYTNFDYNEKNSSVNGYDVSLSATIKMLEIQLAAGPTYQVTDELSIYGGPFLHFVKGEAKIKGSVDGESGDGSCDFKQEPELGGFVGLSTDLAKNTKFNIEYQLAGDAQAVGFRFIHRF